MKCLSCEFMKIIENENEYDCLAKCFKTSKKGKIITWAMNTCSIDNSHLVDGQNRVVFELKSKKSEPHWCPLRKI